MYDPHRHLWSIYLFTLEFFIWDYLLIYHYPHKTFFPAIPINLITVDWIGRKLTLSSNFLFVAVFFLLVQLCVERIWLVSRKINTNPPWYIYIYLNGCVCMGLVWMGRSRLYKRTHATTHAPPHTPPHAPPHTPPRHFLRLTVFIFGVRAFASATFNSIYLYTAEVYPTSIRSIGLGSCSACARLGAMVTPFVAQVRCIHSLLSGYNM